MESKLVLTDYSGIIDNKKCIERILREKKLYKTLSLLLATYHGIDILPTTLLLDINDSIIDKLIEKLGSPMMVRMDYEILPKKKTLGGIPLYGTKIIELVSKFLFNENCFPLFHPHKDRFETIYNVGILLKKESSRALIEVVGKGFDASDIRLGDFRPHEFIEIDIIEGSFKRKQVISDSIYKKQRDERKKKVLLFKKYIEYVNKTGVLLPSLKEFKISSNNSTNNIPEEYSPLQVHNIKSLIETIFIIHTKILNYLPTSDIYVASLSYLPKHGWILWDIYGSWYKR